MEQKINFTCPVGGFKNEATFTTWFGGQISKLGGFFYKISDESRGLKPFDSILSYKGLVASIEFKYTKHASCYPFQLLRGSSYKNTGAQVKSLEEWQRNGGISLVIVYSAKKNRYEVLDFAGLDFTSHIQF